MSIWDICIRRPVFTTMLILAPVVLGMASYARLGVELFPNVDVPVVVVTTTFKGASVEEMETAVTKPVEEAVNTVAGIDELRSTTKEGFSQIVVGFKLEKNGDIAAQEIRDKMTLILGQLPPGTDYPKVEKFNLDATPVVTVAVSGRRDLREISEIAKTKIKEDLEGSVPGVGAVILVGGQQRAVNVVLDPDKLNGSKLTVADVRKALTEQNLELPGGRVDQGKSEQGLRVVGRIQRVEDFRNIVVATRKGVQTKLHEVVSKIEDGIEEPRGLSRLDGDTAVSLVVQKQSGGNTVTVAEAVKARLAKIAATLDPDIRLEVIRDQSKFIEGSIAEVKFHLLLAAVLVSAVLLLFIRDWRTTVIAALAVPTSIVGAFAFMDAMGFSLNNMTLLGLILAVGVVIDDAVVVLENVFRHMEEYGRTPTEAAGEATKEIALAVLATTLSLAVIFAPIAFMTGQIGRFFNSFGFVVAFCILLSMVVSFTLTPMLCARFLRAPRREGEAPAEPDRIRAGSVSDGDLKTVAHASGSDKRGSAGASPSRKPHGAGVWGVITSLYVATLQWSLGGKRGWHRLVVVGVAFVCLMTTPVLFELVGTDFVPKDDQSEFEVALTLAEGTSLQSADETCRELEGKLKTVRGVTNVFTTVGETNGRQSKGQGDVTRVQFYCRMTDLKERKFAQKDAMAEARKMLEDYPDLRATVQEVKLFSSTAFKNVQVEISLTGPDTDALDAYAKKLVAWMKARPETYTDVDTNAAARAPELQVQIRRDRAGDLGVSVQAVAVTLGVMVGGEPVSKFKEKDKPDQYDVWLRALPTGRDRREAIDLLTVRSDTGELIELRNLAELDSARGPATIERYNRQRQLAVTANLAPGAVLGKVEPLHEEFIKSLGMPPEYKFEFLGESKLMKDSNSNFAVAFLLAFVFMYMILAAQFESFVHPITILMAVPLTLPFALLSLLIMRTPLDIYATIGLFMLFGIVKKNGILQVDYTNVLRAKGIERDAAILQANRARLRPILMTTIMLVAAMIPIATGEGPGASARASMAKVILGGQLLSLFLSLLITPVSYSLWDDISRRSGQLRRWVGRLFTVARKPKLPAPLPVVETADAAETVRDAPVPVLKLAEQN